MVLFSVFDTAVVVVVFAVVVVVVVTSSDATVVASEPPSDVLSAREVTSTEVTKSALPGCKSENPI